MKHAEKSAETKGKLLKAAVETMLELGPNADVERICTKAGYAKGSLYTHFSSKDALIQAVRDVVKSDMQDAPALLFSPRHVRLLVEISLLDRDGFELRLASSSRVMVEMTKLVLDNSVPAAEPVPEAAQ